MQISTWVLAESQDTSLICVPYSEGKSFPLRDDERKTLLFLPETIITMSPEALPLQVYIGGGSSHRLQIFPAPGGKIEVDEMMEVEKGERTLTIHRDPLT